MTHTAPRHVGNVQETVDTAQVDKRTVVGDVLDDTFDNRTFVQCFEQLFALFAHAGLKHRTARQHNVVTLAIELDNFEIKRFALVGRGVFNRTHVDQ